MADTSVKLSGTYDSIEAYNILEEMRDMSADYEEIRTEAAAAASAATAAVTTAQTAANSASTYAGNAQTYAGNANTSAGEAAGYASDASTAATNAANSETNASNSASAAATSAANAAASEAVVNGALPLSGGTMTGAIKRDGTAITNSVDTSAVRICGGTSIDNGGVIALFGKSNSSYPGYFSIKADDATNESFLIGTPGGSLTWLNKQMERVNASGTYYIRFESGLQICWGTTASKTTNASTSTTTTVTFPVAFKDTTYTVTFIDWFGSGSWGNHTFSTSSYSTTGIGLYLQNNAVGPYTYSLKWMAIGYWK